MRSLARGETQARELALRMVKQKDGVVLFTTSVHQRIAWSGHAAYVATKGGVEMMMKTLAQEAGPYGVRVLSIAPGAVATPINALFLASDYASYITPTTIFVDGGMTDYPSFARGG
jgi:glucose 1-dehydrogenase